jgi:hypothetical protein
MDVREWVLLLHVRHSPEGPADILGLVPAASRSIQTMVRFPSSHACRSILLPLNKRSRHVMNSRMASSRPEPRLRPDAAEFVMPSQSMTMNSSRSRGSADSLPDDPANPSQPRNLTKSQHQQLKNTLKRLGCDFVHVDALLVAHNERVRPRYRICSVDAITQYGPCTPNNKTGFEY